jgi:hypothetical protein
MLFEYGHEWLEVFLALEELQNLVENVDLAFACALITLLSLCLELSQNLRNLPHTNQVFLSFFKR